MNAKRAFVVAIATVVLVMAGVIAWQQREVHRLKVSLADKDRTAQAQLGDGTIRAGSVSTEPGGAAAAAAAAGVPMGAVKDDVKSHGATVDSTFVGVAKTPGRMQHGLDSSGSEPRPMQVNAPVQQNDAPPGEDKWGYTKAHKSLKLTEPMSDGSEVPFGTVGFSAWQERPWDLTVAPRSYKLVTVGAVTEDGRHLAYGRLAIEVDGKTYPVPIQSATFYEDVPASRFRWRLKPMLVLDAGIGVLESRDGQVLPGIQVALAGRGVQAQLPDWSFLALGLAYEAVSQGAAVTFTPVAWNIGRVVPFFSNTYLGATVSFSNSGVLAVGGGIRVGL